MPALPTLFDYGAWAVCAALALTWFASTAAFGIVALIVFRWFKSPGVRVAAIRAAIVLPIIASIGEVVVRGQQAPPQSVARILNRHEGRVDVSMNQRRVNGNVVSTLMVTDDAGVRGARVIAIVFASFALGGILVFLWRIGKSHRALQNRLPVDERAIAETLMFKHPVLAARPVRFSTSLFVQTPIAISKSEICLPANFDVFPAEERRAILLHEIAHLERRDPQWCLAVDAIFALSCINPIVHWLRRAHRRELEFAADNRAMQWGARPEALLEALHGFAEQIEMQEMRHVGVAFRQSHSPLIERAVAISHWNDSADVRRRSQMALLILLLSIVSIGVAKALPVLSVATPLPSRAMQSGGRQVEDVDLRTVDQSGRPISPRQ